MTLRIRLVALVTTVAVGSLVLSGCVARSDLASTGTVSVNSTDDSCDVSAPGAGSGTVTFEVTNAGEQTTEFYLLAEDGLRIVGEVENIAPGAARTLTLVAQPGEYFTVCKPGMVGDGVGKASFSVTGDAVAVDAEDAALTDQAVELYAAFVKDQVGQLVPAVAEFVTAYQEGDDERARALFPLVRAFYERIEPVAEALGDLDPRIDYREVDAVAEGLPWTGFHRIEKDLWVPAADALNSDGLTPAWQDWEPSTPLERAEYGDLLIADVQELYDYVHGEQFTETLVGQGIAGISNGAIALLDEVATGKISGEEDWWSGTDLYDFAANVEGSKMAFSLVRDFALAQGADGEALVDDIDAGYAALEELLSRHGSLVDGFVAYSALTADDTRALSDQINTLAEPLSQLTVTVLP